MENLKISKIDILKITLWTILFFSGLALIFHIRWLIPYLKFGFLKNQLFNQNPLAYFFVKISINCFYIYISLRLINLLKYYNENDFFEKRSFQLFDAVIVSCLCFATIFSTEYLINHFDDLIIQVPNLTLWGLLNISFRLFTKLLVFENPQTLYLLMAILIWAVKQFVAKALEIKSENEAFI